MVFRDQRNTATFDQGPMTAIDLRDLLLTRHRRVEQREALFHAWMEQQATFLVDESEEFSKRRKSAILHVSQASIRISPSRWQTITWNWDMLMYASEFGLKIYSNTLRGPVCRYCVIEVTRRILTALIGETTLPINSWNILYFLTDQPRA